VAEKIKLSNVLASEQLLPHQARGVIEERLRSAILDGRLPPGTAVRQQELATLFGVSRMPVREALRQLEAQSLLKVEMHKGAVVAPLIGEDGGHLCPARIARERGAAPVDPAARCQRHRQRPRVYPATGNETRHAEIGRLNRLFHMALYSKAPNKKLLRLIENELNEEERFLRFHLSSMGLGKLTRTITTHWRMRPATNWWMRR
jgi:DNA-binding GntR family transcriptional regulator